MDNHIHFSQGPTGSISLLTKQGIVIAFKGFFIFSPRVIKREPDPQVGSQILSPSLGCNNSANSNEIPSGV
jgi:hypothetical protein